MDSVKMQICVDNIFCSGTTLFVSQINEMASNNDDPDVSTSYIRGFP